MPLKSRFRVTIEQLQAKSSTGNDSLNDTTELADALGELFDLCEGFKLAYINMKKDHLRTYGERAHKKCFGNIFPDMDGDHRELHEECTPPWLAEALLVV